MINFANHMKEWVKILKARSDNGVHRKIPSGLSAGDCFDLGVELENFINSHTQPEPGKAYKYQAVCPSFVERTVELPVGTQEGIQIDTWNGLTDSQKVILVRHAPNLTTLQLIEEVETTLRINNA
jgi:hypothetical protein